MSDGVAGRARALPTWTTWAVGLVAVVLVGVVAMVRARGDAAGRYFTAKVERGAIHDVVDLTATLNAVKTVLVGSQVSGTISKLTVDFNSPVHTGQIIAYIDPALFQGALDQAVANLEGAKANLVAADAAVEKANATLIQTKDDYDRNVPLVEKDYVTKEALVISKANYDGAKASLRAAVAGVAQAKAGVDQMAAAVKVAQTDMDYTIIRSPVDGVVVARNVDVGQTVAASLQAPTIFTIAQDLTKMQLYAKTDESDVGRVNVGRPVTFKVDAFPKETFTGVVREIRMNATTVQNVVTYDAIIDFANPELKLFPGMTAYVTIPVASVENVVKVPNSALRYRPPLPPEEIRALYVKYHVTETGPSAAGAALGDERAQPGHTAGAAAESGPRTSSPDYGIVWKQHGDHTLEPVQVALGITDHASTEVVKTIAGQLREGDDLVTGAALASQAGGARR